MDGSVFRGKSWHFKQVCLVVMTLFKFRHPELMSVIGGFMPWLGTTRLLDTPEMIRSMEAMAMTA